MTLNTATFITIHHSFKQDLETFKPITIFKQFVSFLTEDLVTFFYYLINFILEFDNGPIKLIMIDF